MSRLRRLMRNAAARGGILLFFIMALEVMIMISPFAFFFYSVFNPVFHWLGRYAATAWLTEFFLPHMILPPTALLRGVRVLGSVLFVAGCLAFIICALQLYAGKIFRWGVADQGLYRYVRHPQYVALGVWGLGMSILWPRFIVLATLSIMFIVYRWLARDEERRMLAQHRDAYARYQASHGRFLPRAFESRLARLLRLLPAPLRRPTVAPLLVIAIIVGGGFLCREITLRSMPYASAGHLTVLPILPEDRTASASVLDAVLRNDAAGTIVRLDPDADYLGYVMPADYIMQGMIADTGGDSHLFKHHHTAGLITDWVLHPFAHLRRPAAAHMAKMHHVDPALARRRHCPLAIDDPALDCTGCPYRRVILVRVDHRGQTHLAGRDLLGSIADRVPVVALEVDTRSGDIVKTIEVGKSTAWKDVPTPVM